MPVDPRRIAAHELAESTTEPVEGPVEVAGFLMYRGSDDQAWLAVDEDNEEPVVRLVPPALVFETLRGEVSPWLGGPFIYAHRATVAGVLSTDDGELVLSDITTIEVWEDDELIRLSVAHPEPEDR